MDQSLNAMENGEIGAGSDLNSPKFVDGQLDSQVRAISSADQLLEVYRQFLSEDRTRDALRAEVFAAYSGEAPYDNEELKQQAESWRFNLSFGFLEGLVARAQTPLMDLGFDEDYLIQVEGELDDSKMDAIREGVLRAAKAWGEWPNFYDNLSNEMILFGFDNAIFPDDETPWPVFVQQQDGFTHRRSRNLVNKLDIFCWRQRFLIHELYEKIANPDIAAQAGWNVNNVQQALMLARPRGFQNKNFNEWLNFEKDLRASAFFQSVRAGAKEIVAVHGFVREVTGKISHWIALDDPITSGSKNDQNRSNDDQNVSPRLLFKREDRFERMSDMLCYFALEAGDGTWHGAKGLAQRGYNIHSAIDRVRCDILNQAFLSGLIPAKVGNQEQQIEGNIAYQGGFCFLPAEVELQTAKFPGVSPEYFQVDQLLQFAAQERVGDLVPSNPNQPGGDETATKAQIDEARRQAIMRSNIKRFVHPLSQCISIMVRRLCKQGTQNEDALRFQQFVTSKGVTPQDLAMVSGARNFGQVEDVLGETLQSTQVAMAEFAGSTYVDQRWLQKRRMVALLGPKSADEAMPEGEDQLRELKAERDQMEEITSLCAGQPVPVAPDDLHSAHLKVGVQWMMKELSQGTGATIQHLTDVGNHMGGHLEALSKDPTKKQEYEQYKQALTQMGHALDDLEKKAQQGQQQQLQAHADAGHPDAITALSGGGPPQQNGAAPTAPNPTASNKVSESLDIKDLPDRAASQLAAKGGLDATPEEFALKRMHDSALKKSAKPEPKQKVAPGQ